MKHIDISTKVELFRDHLERSPRTILSAKFGDGKTYFLDEVKKAMSVTHMFFTLRPVNYSVASNEDIFEYIKHDILLQLAERELLNDIDYTAIVDSLFNWHNFKSVISFLLQFSQNGKIINTLIKVGEELKKKYEEQEKTWNTYSSGFENQRGGLYEDDTYTKMIKASLEFIKNNVNDPKKTVLIIEDLDRVDPGHLFRILNVLGAHIDFNKGCNKFGFDNIILVLDYSSTEHIFNHFYGKYANYGGYMAKFISVYPFYYSIKELAIEEVYKFITSQCGIPQEEIVDLQITGSNTRFADVINNLSVRDISKALDGIDNQYYAYPVSIREGVTIWPEVKILKILSLLKRLNIEFSLDNFASECKNLKNITALELFGDFLRVNDSIFSGGCYYYHGQQFSVSSETIEGIEHFKLVRNGGGYSRRVDFDDLIEKALFEAKKYVFDL